MKDRFFGGSIHFFCFVLLFSVTLVLSVSISRAMGAVYDDFNGDQIDPTLWDINDPGGILSQSGGLLNIDGPPNSMYGYLRSTYAFRGDFEFVLDYKDFQSTATVFTENCALIWLQVDYLVEDFIYIFRGFCGENHTFASNGMIDGSGLDGVWSEASSESGLLKISRTGSTITTYYDEGTGWVAHGTFSGAFTGDVIIQVAAYTGDNGTFHVSSDWITYEGQMLSPPVPDTPVPDIKANGSDGPLTISQGDLLTVTASLDPGSHDGEDADWWVAATSPFGLYWYTLDSGWIRSDVPIRIYGGPLFSFSPYTILEISTLPIGAYTFYFAVDDDMDDILNATYLDTVLVNIQ